MSTIYVTEHAIERYVERVRPCTADEARQALSTEFIRRAAEFGAPFVKLGTGHHVVIRGFRIITVRPADCRLSTLSLAHDWKHARAWEGRL